MNRRAGYFVFLTLLFTLAWVSTSRPAKPGSFAQDFRTNIWFWRCGVSDVGLDLWTEGLPDLGWNVGGLKQDDLSFATNSVIITGLDLTGKNISDLSPLSSQVYLSSLTARGCPIHDLSPLTNLIRLVSLDLSNTEITDISPIGALSFLRELDISGTKISSIDSLHELKNLIRLNISSTSIVDISPLTNSVSLISLYASHSSLTNLSPLLMLEKLKYLDIDGTDWRDFSAIPLSRLWRLKITPQGSPWTNIDLLSTEFHGRLVFPFYPVGNQDEEYSFFWKENAIKHFTEINGTETVVVEHPVEPNTPIVVEVEHNNKRAQ